MSSIPPNLANILGSIAQTHVSADDTSKTENAKRNKRVADARQLARLADQQEHEVENTDHAEGLRVHRDGEDARNGSGAQDTYEKHAPNAPPDLYTPEGQLADNPEPAPEESEESEEPQVDDHIDLSA